MGVVVLAFNGGCGEKPWPAPTLSTSKVDNKKLKRCLKSRSSISKAGYHYHRLKRGETLYKVSKIYGITVNELIELNNITDHTDIDTGTNLIIAKTRARSGMIWPVTGRISSHYGPRWGSFHQGIDIAAPKGTPIRAASNGLVITSINKSKRYSKYGKTIIIEHANGIRTLYAHNNKNKVKAGECVKSGEIIGSVGSTGNATGNHLHFEVRENGRPSNPTNYLQ